MEIQPKTKANVAFVFQGFIEDINDVVSFAQSKGWNLIFIKKSLRRLRISEDLASAEDFLNEGERK